MQTPAPRTTPSRAAETTVTRRRRIELEILRNSLEHRARGARISVPGTLVTIAVFTTVLRGQVPDERLAIWAGPLVAIILWRGWISLVAGRSIATADEVVLRRTDRRFRASSIVMQLWVGSGVWSCGGYGAETDLYVTLAICIFAVGAAVSLTHDARTVAVSIPLLIGQAIAFWLMKGAAGAHISVPLIPLMLLIIAASRRSEENLKETIRIRFDRDALLHQLEEEKEAALLAAQEADEANRSKSLFMAAASHDLRQPLCAITLLSDTLALHDLSEPARRIVEQQGRSLEVLTHMFDNLLDLSRFDSGDVEARVRPVFLPDLLAEILAEFLPACESKGLRLETNDLDHYVRSDPDLLGRLLRNLLSNAVRYTREGGITVLAERRGDVLEVRVEDTGCGIAPADRQRIFREFVQLDNPARSRDKGVGLGLSIVHRISQLLGHEVVLDSEEGVGTTVTVRLPAVDGDGATSHRELGRAHEAGPIRDDLVVWIVEDDQLVRDAMGAHLEALGVRHAFAGSRDDLERLADASGWPDFAMLDDMLAGDETGLDLARWLAAHVSKERILLVTGNTEPMRLAELEQSGFALRRKPVTSDDLRRWLRSGD